jgi:uncharacterized membrane protein
VIFKITFETAIGLVTSTLRGLAEKLFQQIDKIADRFHNRLPDIEGPDIES